jgi:pyrimidine operon attenuation protein/uracil phosphoribosyltransferase
VDRGGHELPIAADFVGARLEVAEGQDVQVRLREDGLGEDVILVTGRAP